MSHDALPTVGSTAGLLNFKLGDKTCISIHDCTVRAHRSKLLPTSTGMCVDLGLKFHTTELFEAKLDE